jgi:hypothetical protein
MKAVLICLIAFMVQRCTVAVPFSSCANYNTSDKVRLNFVSIHDTVVINEQSITCSSIKQLKYIQSLFFTPLYSSLFKYLIIILMTSNTICPSTHVNYSLGGIPPASCLVVSRHGDITLESLNIRLIKSYKWFAAGGRYDPGCDLSCVERYTWGKLTFIIPNEYYCSLLKTTLGVICYSDVGIHYDIWWWSMTLGFVGVAVWYVSYLSYSTPTSVVTLRPTHLGA